MDEFKWSDLPLRTRVRVRWEGWKWKHVTGPLIKRFGEKRPEGVFVFGRQMTWSLKGLDDKYPGFGFRDVE